MVASPKLQLVRLCPEQRQAETDVQHERHQYPSLSFATRRKVQYYDPKVVAQPKLLFRDMQLPRRSDGICPRFDKCLDISD